MKKNHTEKTSHKIVKHKKAKHGKYFCVPYIRIVSLLAAIAVVLFAHAFFINNNSVLGASTSVYGGCSFWNIFCRMESFFQTMTFRSANVSTSSQQTSDITVTSSTDPTMLSLGDGKYTTSPKKGYIYTCQTSFNGSGAQNSGSWIHGTTWDATAKISVEGNVSWPNAKFTITTVGDKRVFSGNGLPVGYTTGIFPIASTDPAYQFDRNPNSIKTQTYSFSLPLNPQMGESAQCIRGIVGIAVDGIPIFDGLDAEGRDANAHEVQDSCSGHPQESGEYHYHGPSACLPETKEKNMLVGYALDGYGIYSMYDANGKEYTNADLDACHGITSEVMWNGKMQNVYHYVMTREYPYSVGCFKGSSVVNEQQMGNTTANTIHQKFGQNGQMMPAGRPKGGVYPASGANQQNVSPQSAFPLPPPNAAPQPY